MTEFREDWFSYNIENWEKIFHNVQWDVGLKKTVVEIGSFEGRSSVWILENLLKNPDSVMHCIDTFEGGQEYSFEQVDGLYDRFLKNIASAGGSRKVIVHRTLSIRALTNLMAANCTADFVYVDGSHEAPDVLGDLVLSFAMLKKGGVIICDDYLWNVGDRFRNDLIQSPKIAIDSFTNIFHKQIEIFRDQSLYQLAFRKI
ncbi:class I SAM-dependent methyltransferase [Methylobacterium phyllosphaerae]